MTVQCKLGREASAQLPLLLSTLSTVLYCSAAVICECRIPAQHPPFAFTPSSSEAKV